MTFLQGALSLTLLCFSLQSDYFRCENRCRRQQQRCEVHCADKYGGKPGQHLECRSRCLDRYYVCRKEDC